MGVITYSSPLGMSAHFKPERDIVLFDMTLGRKVGRTPEFWQKKKSGVLIDTPDHNIYN